MPASYKYYAVSVERNCFYHRIKLILSPVIGALTVFSFAPFNIWPLAIICLTMQCFFLVTSSYRAAFYQAWLYGIGYFGLGASWVFISVHRYGGANIFLSALLTILLILLMGLYYGIAAYIMRRWLKRNFTIDCICTFPALWLCAEWARGHFFTGFPWLVLGYSQTTGPLASYAPIIGVYGISMLLCISAGVLTMCLFRLPERHYLWGIVILAGIWLLSMILDGIYWTEPDGQTIEVSVVQGNIDQKDKWNPDLSDAITQRYIDLSQPHWSSQLIVWPEAAITTLPRNAEKLLLPVRQKAIANNSAVLFGIPLYDYANRKYYNGAIMMAKNSGYYLKRHLVPFGEFFPFKNTFSWIYHQLDIPLSDLDRGPNDQKPLQAAGNTIAPFICYEIAFPAEVANHLNGANMIVVLTDDSWFGDSLAARQHLQMAQMRAIETGRFVIFASNTGPSALIDPEGHIYGKTVKNQATVLTGSVTPMIGTTPYLIATDHLTGLMITVLLFITVLTQRQISNLHKYQRVEFTLYPFPFHKQLLQLKKRIFND